MRVRGYSLIDHSHRNGRGEKGFEMRCILEVLNLLMKSMFVVRDREELSVSLGMWIFAAGLGWFSLMGK